MSMDWKEALGNLLDSGELPPGEDNATADKGNDAPVKVAGKASRLHVLKERKGRAGKVATIIEGFDGGEDELKELARQLKQRLGVGGSARGGEILIQGDLVEKVISLLKELGYKTNKA